MIRSMETPTADATQEHHYLALKARDARFDGRFFTGVTSTGIYCRPVCKVRTPKQENCRFFELAAQAEQAGFRPCLRCRPELAPRGGTEAPPHWSTQDASAILAAQAARLLDQPNTWCEGPITMVQLAARLGISERHVRRIFEARWGISPLQYLQTRRLLAAKQWLTDTRLPISQVAELSGFTSLRRFNAAFAEHYRLEPRQLRKSGGTHGTSQVLKAAYRPPYDIAAMLGFFATRTIAGVEDVDLDSRAMARTVTLQHAGENLRGWVRMQFLPEDHTVTLAVSESLSNALAVVVPRLRDLLDLDADPMPINTCLASRFPDTLGMRVPGTWDGFELAVRAILGQQITVQAARTLTQRLVARFGAAWPTPFPGLYRSFPDARTLSGATAQDLGELGIVRQRQAAILVLARAVAGGELVLNSSAPVPQTLAALQSIPGIGPWTANYIAMRALRWPDAFPAGDVALQSALGVRDAKHPALEAERASQAWKPWRSYAVLRAWSLSKS
jgi:AraC family transcriptional regulator of adaptative response / DNA-3-methyladenine glycosylase II